MLCDLRRNSKIIWYEGCKKYKRSINPVHVAYCGPHKSYLLSSHFEFEPLIHEKNGHLNHCDTHHQEPI